MDRKEWQTYLCDRFSAEAEFPWAKYPDYAVFRHAGNRKWFALFMDVSREKLGIPGAGTVPVLNLKCSPVFSGSLRLEPGILPAYHMNKANWISVLLDGSVEEEKIRWLVEQSYELTRGKTRRRSSGSRTA